jgi:hypothetical protein
MFKSCQGLKININSMYENQTEFEWHLLDFGKKVEYILAAEMAGRVNANDAYKQIKDLFEDLKKFRKKEKKQDNPLDYDNIPERY